MESLNEDIKTGQFKQVYLMYGEEDYLKKLYKDRMTKAILPDENTMNYSYYDGKDTNVKEVIDLAETLPFFAERRLIVFENTGFFKSATPELADYVKEMSSSTFFLFFEKEVDKRNKMYKAVQKKGRVVELGKQTEADLCKWIGLRVKQEKKKITERTIRYFLSEVGNDMQNILSELEKLFCYTIDQEMIQEEDIDAVCVSQIENKIFQMLDAVAAKQQKRALDLYYDLLALKESPMVILYLLGKQFRMLYATIELRKKGFPAKEIAEKLKVAPFVAEKYMRQVKSFSNKELRRIIEDVADTEEGIKTGRLKDQLGVELFIVKYSSAC